MITCVFDGHRAALSGFARSSAAFFPGFLLIGSIALPALLAPWDDAISVYPHIIVPYIFAIFIGAALIVYARKHFALALRERPSDILIGPEGFRIEGGKLNGFKALWTEIESVRLMGEHARLEIVEDEGSKRDENFWKLVITTQEGAQKVLGTAEDARERDSLQALCDTIHESIPKKGPAGAPIPDAPARFKCLGCGAPAVPADADMVKCAYCGTLVHIPDDVRMRIRAIGKRDAAAQRSEQMIGKLLRQPGALRTSFFVALAAIPSMLAWPAAMVGAGVLYALCYLRVANAFLLGLAAFGVIAALFYLVRGQLTDRQALRLLTLSFAAHAPTTVGGVHHCRQCNGPLVEPKGQMLVRCVYCNAENVLGLDARGEAQKGRAQVESLDEALHKRAIERGRWRWSAAAALTVLAIVAILVRVSAHPPNPLLAIDDAKELKRITFDPFNELQPKLSPDGKQLLYDLRVPGEDSDESIMMAPATGAFRGTEMTQEKVHAIRPLWQGDSKGFLYVSSTKQRDVLRRVDSLTPYASSRDLYTFTYDLDVPTMSPDGQHVAFAGSQSKSAGWFIYIGALDGSPYQQVTAGLNPAWSPDGAHIVYSRTIGSYRQVMVMVLDDTGKLVSTTQVTNEACDHETPVYSPDGTYIAYVGNCNGNKRGKKDLWDLYAMRTGGTSNEQLTDGKADVETPAWSGDYVYFSADVAGNYDIWRVRLVGPLAGHGTKPAVVASITLAPPPPTATATTTFQRPSTKTGPSTRR
jgi:TolB protein